MEKRTKFSLWYYLIVLLLIVALDYIFFSGSVVKEISYKGFRDRLAGDKIESVIITQNKIYGLMKSSNKKKEAPTASKLKKKKHTFSPKFIHPPWRLKLLELEQKYEKEIERQFTVIPLEDKKLVEDLQLHGVDYRGKISSNWLKNIFLNWIIPFGFLFIIWGVIFRRMGGGAGVLNIGKSKAKIYAEDTRNKVTFEDVAGIDEAVEEVKEVVDFLKNPKKSIPGWVLNYLKVFC